MPTNRDTDLQSLRQEIASLQREIVRRQQVEAELSAAKERLRQREEQLRLTFDHAPMGIATSGPDHRLIDVNPAYCAMLGYRREELLRFDDTQLIHPDDIAHNFKLIDELWCGQRDDYTLERRYRRKDGATVYATLHAAMVHDAAGRPLMAVVLVQDRTAQRRAEDEARQHRERLAHVSRLSTLGEMATGIAHEINQPLTAIANYARASHRLLDAGQSDPKELLDVLDKIANQAQRAGEVIRRLRGFIRKRESEREPRDLNLLVNDAIVLAETDARANDFKIVTRLAERPLIVEVDPIQIQQVLLNLIRNAMEAMAGVAAVTDIVTVTLTTAAENPNTAHVSVTDRGSGIDKQHYEQLFSPFFSTKPNGLGMGLSISRSIVSSHGGRLWFESNPDCGVTMHFTLPLSEAQP